MSLAVYEHTRAPEAYTGLDQQWIDGRWREGRAETTNFDCDPFTGATLVVITEADHRDLDEAFAAAARAQKDWRARTPAERSAVLRRTATLMKLRRDEIISWLIYESGSTRIKAALEWQSTHAVVEAAAAAAYSGECASLPTDFPGNEGPVDRKPVGVVGVMSPWNRPLHVTARSLFPALAAGNSAVVKPAAATPVTGGLLIAKLLDEAGLPEGVLNAVVGSDCDLGDAFVTHPVPRVVFFTGSTRVGRRIARLAADSPELKKLELDLGGNSPLVVLDDADLDAAVEAAVYGRFLRQDPSCRSADRLIVDRKVYDAFTERFVARVRELKVGDPSDPETMIGPIIHERQLERLRRYIEEARKSGLKQLLGGDPEDLVLPPHIFSEAPNDHPLAREEIVGPIAPIVRAADEEDALRMANDTEYGLSAGVFTRDIERGVRFAGRLDTRMAHVNGRPAENRSDNPCSDENNYSAGRFHGRRAMEAVTTEQ